LQFGKDLPRISVAVTIVSYIHISIVQAVYVQQ
jgi:hypothetical protein